MQSILYGTDILILRLVSSGKVVYLRLALMLGNVTNVSLSLAFHWLTHLCECHSSIVRSEWTVACATNVYIFSLVFVVLTSNLCIMFTSYEVFATFGISAVSVLDWFIISLCKVIG